jgi:hypothetical protein
MYDYYEVFLGYKMGNIYRDKKGYPRWKEDRKLAEDGWTYFQECEGVKSSESQSENT